MPVVIYFSTVISILYYLGVMQIVILKIAWVMQKTMGTTPAESVNAAGNIFIGQVQYFYKWSPHLNGGGFVDIFTSQIHKVHSNFLDTTHLLW